MVTKQKKKVVWGQLPKKYIDYVDTLVTPSPRNEPIFHKPIKHRVQKIVQKYKPHPIPIIAKTPGQYHKLLKLFAKIRTPIKELIRSYQPVSPLNKKTSYR